MQKKACIYCRVSTTDQSLDRQIADLTEFANRLNYEVVEKITDKISGAKTARQGRDEVINLAKKGKFNYILVTEISRWGRSTIDVITTLESLSRYGVSMISLNGLSFDLSTTEGKFLSTLLAAFAELERAFTSERVKSGMRNRKEKGLVTSRPVFNKKTQRLITKIKTLNLKGLSAPGIAKSLNIDTRTVKKVLASGSKLST